jgi:hypothetical protein
LTEDVVRDLSVGSQQFVVGVLRYAVYPPLAPHDHVGGCSQMTVP